MDTLLVHIRTSAACGAVEDGIDQQHSGDLQTEESDAISLTLSQGDDRPGRESGKTGQVPIDTRSQDAPVANTHTAADLISGAPGVRQ